MKKDDQPEQITVWRPDDLLGIELRKGSTVTEPYPRHWHEEYQFCLIQAGGGELLYRGAHYDTPATSLFIVHPGEVHANRTALGCSFRSLYVEPDLIRQTLTGVVHRRSALPFFPQPMVSDQEITSHYLALHLALENSATTLQRESIMLALLTKLTARYAEPQLTPQPVGKEHSVVKKIRDYIIDNHARNISLKELAHLAALSQFHLHRVFTKEVGISPHAFQIHVRVEQAKKLIRRGLPLSIVAAMAGFADQSHFVRHFKRLVKITPGAYRKTARTFKTTLTLTR